MVKLLLERGADPNRANNCGWVPLHEALMGEIENTDKVQLLVDGGADPHKANLRGATPLSFAHDKGYLDIVNIFTNAGV